MPQLKWTVIDIFEKVDLATHNMNQRRTAWVGQLCNWLGHVGFFLLFLFSPPSPSPPPSSEPPWPLLLNVAARAALDAVANAALASSLGAFRPNRFADEFATWQIDFRLFSESAMQCRPHERASSRCYLLVSRWLALCARDEASRPFAESEVSGLHFIVDPRVQISQPQVHIHQHPQPQWIAILSALFGREVNVISYIETTCSVFVSLWVFGLYLAVRTKPNKLLPNTAIQPTKSNQMLRTYLRTNLLLLLCFAFSAPSTRCVHLWVWLLNQRCSSPLYKFRWLSQKRYVAEKDQMEERWKTLISIYKWQDYI